MRRKSKSDKLRSLSFAKDSQILISPSPQEILASRLQPRGFRGGRAAKSKGAKLRVFPRDKTGAAARASEDREP